MQLKRYDLQWWGVVRLRSTPRSSCCRFCCAAEENLTLVAVDTVPAAPQLTVLPRLLLAVRWDRRNYGGQVPSFTVSGVSSRMGVRVGLRAWIRVETRSANPFLPVIIFPSFFLFFRLFEKSPTASSVLYPCWFYAGEKNIGKLVGFGLRTTKCYQRFRSPKSLDRVLCRTLCISWKSLGILCCG